MPDPKFRSDGDTGRVEVKETTCYMCACRCGIRVHLRDGEIRYIEGNPSRPLNQGVICAKGSSGIMKQCSPGRLTKPLLRRSGAERGQGAFEPVSWEPAFDLLAERLRKIRSETAGTTSTPRSPATRSPSMPCAGWRPTPTVSRPFGRLAS